MVRRWIAWCEHMKPIRTGAATFHKKCNSPFGEVLENSRLGVRCERGFIESHTTRLRTISSDSAGREFRDLLLSRKSKPTDHQRNVEEHIALDRLLRLIHRLRPMDRQVMLLYLEDMDAESIGEITGISAGNVRVLVHRVKSILARQFHEGRLT